MVAVFTFDVVTCLGSTVGWSAGKTMSWPVPLRPARTSGPVSRTPPGASDQSVVSQSVQVEGSPEGPTSTLEEPENCCTDERVEMARGGRPEGRAHWSTVNVAQTMLKSPRVQFEVSLNWMLNLGREDA